MLLGLLEEIRDAEKAILKTQEALKVEPSSLPLRLTLGSLLNRAADLEEEFSEVASQRHLDVCSYRIMWERDSRQSLLTLGKIFSDFQTLFSLVYDALKSKEPKLRSTFPHQSAEESALEFGYSFSGSLGFVFTMPNDRLLFGESTLDEAMRTVFDLTRLATGEEVAGYASIVGPAPMRLLHNWASDHIFANINAEISWRREDTVRSSALIQVPELERLCKVLDSTSNQVETKHTGKGYLYAGDLKSKTFKMIFGDNELQVKGKIADDFRQSVKNSKADQLVLGEYYTATIKRRQWTKYSTDKESLEYTLLALD